MICVSCKSEDTTLVKIVPAMLHIPKRKVYKCNSCKDIFYVAEHDNSDRETAETQS